MLRQKRSMKILSKARPRGLYFKDLTKMCPRNYTSINSLLNKDFKLRISSPVGFTYCLS